MKLDQNIISILDKALDEKDISREEALKLMSVDLLSQEMYAICGAANALSRRHFDNLAEIYVQIGLDFAPCPGNCEFCSFGAEHGIVKEIIEYPTEEIVRAAQISEKQGANGVYLMTTARYRFDKFLDVSKAVKQAVSPDFPLVANINDFNENHARDLAGVGFKAVYHAVRLNEGIGTVFSRERRLRTLEAARYAGLNLHFCVEPVGPEHSPKDQVDLMFLSRQEQVTFSGAMRRVCVPRTKVASQGQISWWDLARTVAVTRLVMGKSVLGHCTHEPNLPAILAGANLLWAEVGTNPRDDKPDTENFRGMTISQCQALLQEAGYEIRQGAAITATAPYNYEKIR
jgi:biotin synthase